MEDLSKHYYGDQSYGLTGGESMNGANMISTRPDSLMSAPGSAPILPPPPAGTGSTDNPGMEVPSVKGPTVLVNKGGDK